MLHKIEVGTRLVDNQDGGYTVYVYPSYETALAAKRKAFENWLTWNKVRDENGEILSNEQALAKFDDEEGKWEWEYECGYLDKDTLTISIADNTPQHILDSIEIEECSFHAGQ